MDISKFPEKELLNTCIQGSKEAWDVFVEKYTNLIYHTINKTLKTYSSDFLYQVVSDIHNSVFLSLIENDYKKLKQYEGRNGCTVASWLMIVTSNHTLSYIKRQKQHIPLENDKSDCADVIDQVPGSQERPEEVLSNDENRDILKKLVKDLNSKDVIFMKLYYEEELPPEEISEILGLTVSTVYSKKNRIREKLIKIAKKKNLLQDN